GEGPPGPARLGRMKPGRGRPPARSHRTPVHPRGDPSRGQRHFRDWPLSLGSGFYVRGVALRRRRRSPARPINARAPNAAGTIQRADDLEPAGAAAIRFVTVGAGELGVADDGLGLGDDEVGSGDGLGSAPSEYRAIVTPVSISE